MKKLLLLLSAVTLVSCATSSTKIPQDTLVGYRKYNNDLLTYSIQIPERAYIPNKDPMKDQVFFGNIKQLSENPPDAIDILLLGRDPAVCTPFALGVSDLREREVDGTKVWTGLVDAYDIEITHDYAGETAPPCRPPDLTYSADPNDYGDSMTRIDNSAAYALCSEKDGKRVVVCVQQMTDNPELAEEIFSTFRWTE